VGRHGPPAARLLGRPWSPAPPPAARCRLRHRVGRQLAPGGRFYASYFHAPIGHPLDESLNDGRRWAERNAFFHYGGDLVWAARCADLRVQFIGAWGHPGGQRMALFTHRLVRPRAFAERARRDLSPRLKRPIKRALGDRI
jgi:hypothetical protein